jgi:hypothetical protein
LCLYPALSGSPIPEWTPGQIRILDMSKRALLVKEIKKRGGQVSFDLSLQPTSVYLLANEGKMLYI